MGVHGQRSARMDCLHFRSRTSSSKDEERANTSGSRSITVSGSASKLDEQCSWTSSSVSRDSEADLLSRQRTWALLTLGNYWTCNVAAGESVTCHCLLMSELGLWAPPQCSSCSSSSVWPFHCLTSHSVPLSSLHWDEIIDEYKQHFDIWEWNRSATPNQWQLK